MTNLSQGKNCKKSHKKSLSLANVIAGSIKGRFLGFLNGKGEKMPSTIGKLDLVREVFKSGEGTRVSQGIYKNRNGKVFL